MKKNWVLRLGLLAMVLTLVTMPMVSSTYAKYVTTANGTAKARVAKWGVEITASADDDVFAMAYNETGTVTVVSTEYVVAPGTDGAFAGVFITGKPEVDVNVKLEADLKFTGWTVTRSGKVYMPIKITVAEEEYNWSDYATLAKFETAVEDAIAALSKDYDAGTDLSTITADFQKFSWEWDFETGTDVSAYYVNTGSDTGALATGYYVSGTVYYNSLDSAQTNDLVTGVINTTEFQEVYDVEDTALGKLAADGSAPTISLEISVTVTQID